MLALMRQTAVTSGFPLQEAGVLVRRVGLGTARVTDSGKQPVLGGEG